jgi:hypothetical protein
MPAARSNAIEMISPVTARPRGIMGAS